MGLVRTRQAELPLTIEIVEAVADQKGVDGTSLPPLADVVDTDALDALFAHQRDGTEAFPTVRFHYCGRTVVVDEDRTISLE